MSKVFSKYKRATFSIYSFDLSCLCIWEHDYSNSSVSKHDVRLLSDWVSPAILSLNGCGLLRNICFFWGGGLALTRTECVLVFLLVKMNAIYIFTPWTYSLGLQKFCNHTRYFQTNSDPFSQADQCLARTKAHLRELFQNSSVNSSIKQLQNVSWLNVMK